jgi:hypothetical protein
MIVRNDGKGLLGINVLLVLFLGFLELGLSEFIVELGDLF